MKVFHSDKISMKPLDYTLYNKVKEKFPPQAGAIIFVSLSDENLESLEGIVFEIKNLVDLENLVGAYGKDAIPFATIGGFANDNVSYNFLCREFEQEEDLVSGKIVASSIGTYHNEPVDIEALKKEIQSFHLGTHLSGNT